MELVFKQESLSVKEDWVVSLQLGHRNGVCGILRLHKRVTKVVTACDMTLVHSRIRPIVRFSRYRLREWRLRVRVCSGECETEMVKKQQNTGSLATPLRTVPLRRRLHLPVGHS